MRSPAYLSKKNQGQPEPQNLWKSQEKYKLIFNLSPEAIVVLDKKGNFLEVIINSMSGLVIDLKKW